MVDKDIEIEDYNYVLPDEKIAKHPVKQRDESKLLVYKEYFIHDVVFNQIEDYLPKESMLIFNNAKVIHARLHFKKSTGAAIEIFCLEPFTPSDYALSLQSNQKVTWRCIVGNAKKWKDEPLKVEAIIKHQNVIITATKIGVDATNFLIQFDWNNPSILFSDILEQFGNIPIPPYLNRDAEDVDTVNYQTIYSKVEGSVAAPTAGLHFSEKLIARLLKKGFTSNEITLHVSAGTFAPVKAEKISEHPMHTEHFAVSLATLNAILAHEAKIIPVGTTSVRTLESLYWMGVKLLQGVETPFHISQWEVYDLPQNIDLKVALSALLEHLHKNNLGYINGSTQIIIIPGYQFKVIGGLITNFHQPKSTLLLLVSALLGSHWKAIYNHAMNNDYRFLSYGDSSLLLPEIATK